MCTLVYSVQWHPLTRRATSATALEGAILQSSLPDTIWVRVYEDRMDLLRAVMIGPEAGPARLIATHGHHARFESSLLELKGIA